MRTPRLAALLLLSAIASSLAAQAAPKPAPVPSQPQAPRGGDSSPSAPQGLPTRLPAPPEAASPGIPPDLEDRAITMDITFRVTSAADSQVVWEQKVQRASLPNQTVSARMVAPNVVIVVRLNPVPKGDGYTLRAVGQVWISDGSSQLRYHGTATSLDVEEGDTVAFYPLGTKPAKTDLIEVLISLKPYKPEGR